MIDKAVSSKETLDNKNNTVLLNKDYIDALKKEGVSAFGNAT